MTRREALRKALVFSTGLLTVARLEKLMAQPPLLEFSGDGIHLLAIGDFGTGKANQAAVARQMSQFAKKLKVPLTAVLALGDNFYGNLVPQRFRAHFEEMYSKENFNCPFYACLGNHDYGPLYDGGQGRIKAQMQLDYASQNPSSRWKMPGKWYALELPNAETPLVKIVVLDGNMFDGALTPSEKVEQKHFLEAELKKQTRAPWRWMVSHYPLFSAGVKGDNARLVREWGDYLKSGNISFYLAGHDHNLQHLEVPDYHASFVVSGAGGAGLYNIKSAARGFAQKILGFTHLYVTPDTVTAQFLSVDGACLHAFRRTRGGEISIVS
jgi:hypothetical protein